MFDILVYFLPIGLFFVTFKIYGLMIATQVAIATSLLQLLWTKITTGKLHKMHLASTASILVFGGATLLLNNELYVKWKPTALYWLLATGFFMTQFVGKKPLIQTIAGSSLELPSKVWKQLNLTWSLFFFSLGLANIYVLYNFDTEVWVNFKLFGTLGITILFVIIQSLYMAKHQLPNRSS